MLSIDFVGYVRFNCFFIVLKFGYYFNGYWWFVGLYLFMVLLGLLFMIKYGNEFFVNLRKFVYIYEWIEFLYFRIGLKF